LYLLCEPGEFVFPNNEYIKIEKPPRRAKEFLEGGDGSSRLVVPLKALVALAAVSSKALPVSGDAGGELWM